ncbi:MAG TPA: DUF4139 domain-containing protein [Bryobacteraceae bacterium]
MRRSILGISRFVSIVVFVSFAAMLNAAYSAEIPIKRIVLYKHGVGFFERDGTVAADQQALLEFETADMNDVLKSLTVAEAAGHRISTIRYDANETLDQRLSRYPFSIGDRQPFSTFLDSLKGARIELKIADRTNIGVIAGARRITGGDTKENLEQISLLLDSGDLANYDLAAVTSLRLLDPRLQEQLKQYLETLGQSRVQDHRRIFIDFADRDAHNLHVTYIRPAAIWKSSYRLTLDPSKSLLEGWAIVDNTTGEDWNNVNLSVVSGRPISFISLLDTPRFGRRTVAELPEDRAAGPVVYSGSVDAKALTPAAGLGSGEGVAGVIGGVVGSVGTAPAPSAKRQFVANQLLAASTVQGANGTKLGELFEYHFPTLVTIRKNESAMLPFLQNRIEARKLLIYTNSDGEHPVNAAEITNDTGKTLDGGPITVYDGGTYAGEALVETLKAGDKRLIGYAVDYGTRITSAFNSGVRDIREIHVKNGVLSLRCSERDTRTYTINNVDSKAKTLILQQEDVSQYTVLSPKPLERTANAYRFQVGIPANTSRDVKIELEKVIQTSESISSSSPDFLMTLVTNKDLDAVGRRQLNSIVDLKRQILETKSAWESAKAQISDLTDDQNRLRQNIDSLNRVKGQEQVRNYSETLSKNEVRLAQLRDREKSLASQQAQWNTRLRDDINALDF